jgi:hypothetical protein
MKAKDTNTARLLLARLERLSADSHYAHRASGLRGSLLRYLDMVEGNTSTGAPAVPPAARLDDLLSLGFEILEKAARQIRPPRPF